MIQDILLDEFNDLAEENGDFVAGNSTGQHFKLLLSTNKGDWKHAPYVGIGLQNFLSDEQGLQNSRFEIKKQCEVDGATIENITFVGSQINIKGNYENT
jgi:hypothetical protein